MTDNFSKQITNKTIERICSSLGFQVLNSNAVDALSDVVKCLIELVASECIQSCELGGRVCPGIQDLIPVLDRIDNRVCDSIIYPLYI